MATIWLQVIAGLAGVVTLWLRDYYSAGKVQAREDDKRDEAIEEGRQDIVDGNADAVAARINRLLKEDGGDAGSTGAKDVERRIRAL